MFNNANEIISLVKWEKSLVISRHTTTISLSLSPVVSRHTTTISHSVALSKASICRWTPCQAPTKGWENQASQKHVSSKNVMMPLHFCPATSYLMLSCTLAYMIRQLHCTNTCKQLFCIASYCSLMFHPLGCGQCDGLFVGCGFISAISLQFALLSLFNYGSSNTRAMINVPLNTTQPTHTLYRGVYLILLMDRSCRAVYFQWLNWFLTMLGFYLW